MVLVLAVLVLVHNLLQCGKERCMLVQDGEAEVGPHVPAACLQAYAPGVDVDGYEAKYGHGLLYPATVPSRQRSVVHLDRKHVE